MIDEGISKQKSLEYLKFCIEKDIEVQQFQIKTITEQIKLLDLKDKIRMENDFPGLRK